MTATKQAIELTKLAASAAEDKLAENLVALDVSEPFALADVFLIASAKNERQAAAIADAIEEKLQEAGYKAKYREGMAAARWILLDFGDLVVHIMNEDEREYYSLERLWRDCPVVSLSK
ncbi:MAG: ribosome silencing factor [Actinobacteria bacterium]|nr:ribosome silencing factor [Actinomycetota bacterium]